MDKLKVLFLAANPDDTTRLGIDKEVRSIREKLRASVARDQVELETRWAVRPDDLLHELNEYQPHVVHFSGHGDEHIGLAVLDDRGESLYLTAYALGRLFRTLKDQIRLVVLNACYSLDQAQGILESVDFVVGMNTTIGDLAAEKFSAAFYRALATGRSLQNAFEQGQTAIALHGLPEDQVPELLHREGLNPAEVYLLLPPSEPAGTVSNPLASEPVEATGDLVLLGDHFFEAISVSADGKGTIRLTILSGSPKDEAVLNRFAKERNRGALLYAYGNEGGFAEVRDVSSTLAAGQRTWQVHLEPREEQAGIFSEFGALQTGSRTYSSTDIALLRARRILLNEHGHGQFEGRDSMLEVMIRGRQGEALTVESPFPALYQKFKGQPVTAFLQAARLVGIAHLKASLTAEHVLSLVLGPVEEARLRVRFEGQRPRIYSNEDPPILKLTGECPLE